MWQSSCLSLPGAGVKSSRHVPDWEKEPSVSQQQERQQHQVLKSLWASFHAAVGTPGRKERPEASWTSSSHHHLWSQTSVYQCVTPSTEPLNGWEFRPSTLTSMLSTLLFAQDHCFPLACCQGVRTLMTSINQNTSCQSKNTPLPSGLETEAWEIKTQPTKLPG